VNIDYSFEKGKFKPASIIPLGGEEGKYQERKR